MNLNIGAVIRKLRTERGMTQEELAEKVNVSFQTVSKWECGTTTPDIATLPVIALLFGISMDTLFSMDSDDYLERIQRMIRDEHTISSENFIWAERYLKGVLTENHTDNNARTLLVELYAHRENRDSLAQGRLAEEGILIDPSNVALNAKLMHVREKRNEADRLIAFWEPLLKKDAKNYVIRENLIGVCIRNRYFEKAVALIQSSPSPRAVYDLFLGDISLCEGDENAAKRIWRAATENMMMHKPTLKPGKDLKKSENTIQLSTIMINHMKKQKHQSGWTLCTLAHSCMKRWETPIKLS